MVFFSHVYVKLIPRISVFRQHRGSEAEFTVTCKNRIASGLAVLPRIILAKSDGNQKIKILCEFSDNDHMIPDNNNDDYHHHHHNNILCEEKGINCGKMCDNEHRRGSIHVSVGECFCLSTQEKRNKNLKNAQIHTHTHELPS